MTNIPDRGYTNLLAHLQQSNLSLPLETLQAAIAYYLVNSPFPHSTPTSLTATVICSPVWHPHSLTTTTGLATIFRHALQLKYNSIKTDASGLFYVSVPKSLSDWLKAVLKGMENGDVMLRLAISGGMLLGLDDLKEVSLQGARHSVEEELVIAFAECMDNKLAAQNFDDGWEKEFLSVFEERNDQLALALLLVSQYLPYVSDGVISNVTDLCLSTIRSTFYSGQFARDLESSTMKDATTGHLVISETSSYALDLKRLTSSDDFKMIGAVCKLLCQIIGVSTSRTSRSSRREAWDTLLNVANTSLGISADLERDWAKCQLASIKDEDQIDPKSREITAELWAVFKTLLFSKVMLAQAVLSAVVFLPPPAPRPLQQSPEGYLAADLATSILRNLSHLSFIISKFGGVAVSGSSRDEDRGGFKELKKVFYTALDILSAHPQQSEIFIETLANALLQDDFLGYGHPLYSAQRAYALVCAEQLVPVLSEACIEAVILPMCQPHLADPLHRETYESAHSVMLAIFSAHPSAQVKCGSVVGRKKVDGKGKRKDVWEIEGELAKRLVPGYVKSLLYNSREGKLNTPQLRLAYASLVRSTTVSENGAVGDGCHHIGNGDEALAWLCVEGLLDAIHSNDSKPVAGVYNDSEHLKLSLTLISLVPNVSLTLLPRVLGEVEGIVEREKGPGRQVLVDALFEEILHRVGDKEKEYALRWWFYHTHRWCVPDANTD